MRVATFLLPDVGRSPSRCLCLVLLIPKAGYFLLLLSINGSSSSHLVSPNIFLLGKGRKPPYCSLPATTDTTWRGVVALFFLESSRSPYSLLGLLCGKAEGHLITSRWGQKSVLSTCYPQTPWVCGDVAHYCPVRVNIPDPYLTSLVLLW